jgi:protein involved in polysaccharide export with SLBB domain
LIRKWKTPLILFLVFSTVPPPWFPVWAASKIRHKEKKAAVEELTVVPKNFRSSYPSLLIGPGDELEIYVVNFSSGNGYVSASLGETGPRSQLPTDYLVDSNGVILFPFLGEVALAGLTQSKAAQLLSRKLESYINDPQVTVLVRSSNHYNISVLGQVSHPGLFLIRGEPTVFSLLAEAGGPLENANLETAFIVHGDTLKKEPIHLERLLKDKDPSSKPPLLYPGDMLMIPKKEGLTAGDWAIIASILASGAIIAYQIK